MTSNGKCKDYPDGKGEVVNDTLMSAPEHSTDNGTLIYPTKCSLEKEEPAKKRYTPLPEPAMCNARVGYPVLCPGSEDGTEPVELAEEMPHKSDVPDDLPVNELDVAVTKVRMYEEH